MHFMKVTVHRVVNIISATKPKHASVLNTKAALKLRTRQAAQIPPFVAKFSVATMTPAVK